MVMMSLSTHARYLDSRMRHHFWFRVIASCLLLTGGAYALRAQSCTDFSTCSCSATVNPVYCDNCLTDADVVALGCALSGNCDWLTAATAAFAQCIADITPPLPAPPTPTSQGQQCGQPEVLRASRSARQPGFSPVSLRPADTVSFCGTITFLDPVPNLQAGYAITTSSLALTSQGSPVNAIAAEGAARVVLRIPAQNQGDTLLVTVSNPPGSPGPNDPASIGGLYSIGSPDNPTQSRLSVKASYTDSQGNPLAIVVYRAPSDFVRGGAHPVGADITAQQRSVQFQAAGPGYEIDGVLNIVRPPVVLVHGIWDSAALWKNFLSGANKDSRFTEVDKVNYDINVTGEVSYFNTDCVFPGCSAAVALSANANQLGFAYNAPSVMITIESAITNLKTKAPGGPAAVAQADVVAHSMGALVTRQAETLPGFADASSFGVGNIHKLITVGSPHFGSPFATMMLQDECMSFLKSLQGTLVLGQTVTLTNGQPPVTGGIFDLQGNAAGTAGLSKALNDLNNRSGYGVQTHLIAGSMSDENFGVAGGGVFMVPNQVCNGNNPVNLLYGPSLMASETTSYQGWTQIFGGNNSDAIVGVSSQLASQSGGNTDTYPNLIHSSGLIVSFTVPLINKTVNLGLLGPAELDLINSYIPTRIIDLLSEPITGTGLFQPIPK